MTVGKRKAFENAFFYHRYLSVYNVTPLTLQQVTPLKPRAIFRHDKSFLKLITWLTT